jgi:hypothetical protein
LVCLFLVYRHEVIIIKILCIFVILSMRINKVGPEWFIGSSFIKLDYP